MDKSKQQEAAEVIRTFENRLVWLATFLVEVRGQPTMDAAKRADRALDEYQQRFPAIQPPD